MNDAGAWLSWKVLLLAQLRQQPARLLLMVAVIALGVALGTSVYLINATALNEFTLASKRLIGEADVVVRGSSDGFPEALYPLLARNRDVRVASPVLELQAAIPARTLPLKILGIDLFRAAALQPALLSGLTGDVRRMFAPDGLFLSRSAAAELRIRPHQELNVVVGTSPVALEVLGILPDEAYAQPLGLMDIASAQWTFRHLGRLNRIDLALYPGTDAGAFRRSLAPDLPAGVLAVAPEVERDRARTVTRAYRVNLNMLALVSLLTSAFLVFSIQSLSMLRRRGSIALLRALGVTGPQIRRALLAEGALIGALGSAAGVVTGIVVATAAVRWLNGDLGNAQIHVAGSPLALGHVALAVAFVIGTVFSCAGAWLPAREAARRPPALALKSGDSELSLDARRLLIRGALGIAAGCGLMLLPASGGVPVAGYAAIAAFLFGAILWVPTFTRIALRALPRTGRPILDAAVAQLGGSQGTLFLSLAPIIVSFALMVSMAIMVHSFRQSFEAWLVKLLPADMELRLPPGTNTAGMSEDDQRAIRSMPGVVRAEFRRSLPVYLDAASEPVTLIARDMDRRAAGEILPLVAGGPAAGVENGVWVSEAAHDKYGFSVGQTISIPLAGRAQPWLVLGVWRDYARTNGALVVARGRYTELTGDRLASESSLWTLPGASPAAIEQAIRARFPGGAIELMSSSDIREHSLAIFDRAFAITYALEALAVLIGLAGISVAASYTAITRRAEFGMLRHIGMLRSQVIRMLAAEGIATALLGALYGLALGIVLSLILIFVINRQSFNWSIDLSLPAAQLAAFAAALIAAAAITAILSGRSALGADAVRAVREDW